MENIKGIIEEKSIKNSPEGSNKKWTRAAYKIAGLTLATFDEEIIEKYNTGMKVDVDYEINEQGEKHYNNVVKMKALVGEVPATQSNQGKSFKSPEDQLKIIRQSCLKASAQMMVVIKDSEKVKKSIEDGKLMDLYLNTTDVLVDYVLNGIQIKAEEKKEDEKKETESSSMPDY